MDYLERNKALIAEINAVRCLTIGREIGNGTQTTTTTELGNYQSKVLGKPIYLAMKKINVCSNIHGFVVSKELGIIRTVEQRYGHLLPEFPIVHGLLVDGRGEEVGIITEDFSEGRAHEVYSLHEGDILPLELRSAFGHVMDKDDLATTCFSVNGKRRIGDFGEFSMHLPISDWENQFRYKDIRTRLKDFTAILE